MDAFEIHRRLIKDYRDYTLGFVDILDTRLVRLSAHWPTTCPITAAATC